MKHFLVLFIIILIGLSGLATAASNTSTSNSNSKLKAQVANLTKENRQLKAELANQTKQINQLKAKVEFLEQQNEEYRKLIQGLLKEQAQKSEQDYVKKAKKERLIGSVLLKSILVSLAVVGLVGYGLYRVKRRHEFAGL